MNYLDIGRKIRALRQEQDLTMAELSRRTGFSQPQMSRLERGLQGLRSAALLRIAKALDVDPVYFFIDHSREDADSLPYGLLAGGSLVEALRSPEFVQLAQGLADAYLRRKDAFSAMQAVARVVLEAELRSTGSRPASRSSRRAPRPSRRASGGAAKARRRAKR